MVDDALLSEATIEGVGRSSVCLFRDDYLADAYRHRSGGYRGENTTARYFKIKQFSP